MRRDLVRRAALLCVHFTRNLAYYRAGFDDNKKPFPQSDFWINANTNFVDQVILHWCHLFGSKNQDKHHWQNVVPYQSKFKAGLLDAMRFKDSELSAYWKKMKDQRDQFIAHLDQKDIMYVPILDPAFMSVKYYFEYLKESDNGLQYLNGLPTDLDKYFHESFTEARKYYEQHRP